ncbi:MAG TPA: hypothetical protein VH165_02360 [Kofleriaceae bacterium]|nr:hypothetical protein [Kofleriaceae bacterium]
MRHPSSVLAAVIVLLAVARPAAAWTGPQASFDNKNGRQVLKLCDQGGSCTLSTPFFLALVSSEAAATFLYEARLQLAYLSASANGVTPVLQVHLASTDDATIAALVSTLNQLSPRPYLYVRYYMDATGTFETMQNLNLQGVTRADTGGGLSKYSLSEPWLEYQEAQITRVLNAIDAGYPGKLMGVNVGYENGGEWFFRPYGYDLTQAQPMVGEGVLNNQCVDPAGNVTPCTTFPWVNDLGTTGGPIGRQQFYVSDYSATATAGFCSWSALPSSLLAGCRAANLVERNNAAPGQSGAALGLARGVFLDPADLGSLRAAYYNRYAAVQNVNAITRVLAKAKQISGNRILTSAFYGYLNDGLNVAMANSGQTALSQLLASSSIDIVAAPYSYAFSRALGNPFTSQGISDSPRVGNKMYFDEDDTRTHLAPPGVQQVTTLWDSIRILRRNLLTAGLHDRGSWFLDLGQTGWFGRPDMDSDSQQLWANLTSAFSAVNKLQLNAPNGFKAQVAVFTDDLSPSYVAGLSPAGENSYGFSNDTALILTDALARLGTPVKHYLLSDLLQPNLDLSAIKLAVLNNAWNVPTNLRQAIDAKLRTPGRTLLFVYAAGYLNQDAAASPTGISALTGITVALGTGMPVLGESFNVNGQNIAGGPGYPLTPWFKITDAAATSLGTYTTAGGTSLARKTIAGPNGTYTSIFAAAPALPLPVLRKLSEDAGVFHFTAMGDIVEAAGNMMLVHAATTGFKTISFPQSMSRIFETALYPSDTLMCNNCAALAQLPFNAGDTRAFRWTSAPTGNFELISGTTLQGWAVDFDVPDSSIAINTYIGGPFGLGGTFQAGFAASGARPDVAAAFGISPNHGFSFQLPSCPSGQPIYAYALDPETGGDGSAFIGVHTCP